MDVEDWIGLESCRAGQRVGFLPFGIVGLG